LAEQNQLARQIGELMKIKNLEEAESLKQRVAQLKDSSKTKEDLLKTIRQSLDDKLITLPNIPHSDVPSGQSADDNMVFQAWEKDLPTLGKGALPHWELAEKYNLFDMKLGVKLTGSGFILYRSKGAKLQRALINYFLDYNTAAGYEEILPPHLVNEDSARSTGQLPDKEGQMYYCEKDDYLIPTAEVPVTNIFRDVILPDDQLPACLTAYTPCFRRSRSYGAHVKGLNRVHQFDKVK
jgi:seryl-tRNA synthetase